MYHCLPRQIHQPIYSNRAIQQLAGQYMVLEFHFQKVIRGEIIGGVGAIFTLYIWTGNVHTILGGRGVWRGRGDHMEALGDELTIITLHLSMLLFGRWTPGNKSFKLFCSFSINLFVSSASVIIGGAFCHSLKSAFVNKWWTENIKTITYTTCSQSQQPDWNSWPASRPRPLFKTFFKTWVRTLAGIKHFLTLPFFIFSWII